MRKLISGVFLAVLFSVSCFSISQAQETDEIAGKTKAYFGDLFARLKVVARQNPTPDTYRQLMRPEADKIEGFFGGSFIDPDFIIRQVYHPSHFLARGFDLKKVKELKDFYKMMQENPAPQLSEPAHGSIVQPRLTAMRYPVIKEGRLVGIISMMVRTEYFLRAVGLDKCKAFKIICLGQLAEERGKLSPGHKEIKLDLPSTRWVIQYDK